MEDNYFDEHLKNILENPPDFEPDAKAIADMNRRLDSDQQTARRWVLPLWWLIPLLLLPFLFGGIYLFTKYQKLNRKLDDLTLHTTKFYQDTINNQHITYQYDTIYRVIYQDSIVKRYYEQTITRSTPTGMELSRGWPTLHHSCPMLPLAPV